MLVNVSVLRRGVLQNSWHRFEYQLFLFHTVLLIVHNQLSFSDKLPELLHRFSESVLYRVPLHLSEFRRYTISDFCFESTTICWRLVPDLVPNGWKIHRL